MVATLAKYSKFAGAAQKTQVANAVERSSDRRVVDGAEEEAEAAPTADNSAAPPPARTLTRARKIPATGPKI